jgi:hypothetical protein
MLLTEGLGYTPEKYGQLARAYANLFPNRSTCERWVRNTGVKQNVCQFRTETGEIQPLTVPKSTLFSACMSLCLEHPAWEGNVGGCEKNCFGPFTKAEQEEILAQMQGDTMDFLGFGVENLMVYGLLGVGAYFGGKKLKQYIKERKK